MGRKESHTIMLFRVPWQYLSMWAANKCLCVSAGKMRASGWPRVSLVIGEGHCLGGGNTGFVLYVDIFSFGLEGRRLSALRDGSCAFEGLHASRGPDPAPQPPTSVRRSRIGFWQHSWGFGGHSAVADNSAQSPDRTAPALQAAGAPGLGGRGEERKRRQPGLATQKVRAGEVPWGTGYVPGQAAPRGRRPALCASERVCV